MTLVDTSSWIALFRGDGDAGERVKRLLLDGEPTLCGPVFTELSRGLRGSDRQHVLSLLAACKLLPQPAQLWSHAGELGRQLRTKGVTAKTLDLLIATYALTHRCELLTVDGDFVQMRDVGIPLRLA
jgi:predicted nucleic acid-binding protein